MAQSVTEPGRNIRPSTGSVFSKDHVDHGMAGTEETVAATLLVPWAEGQITAKKEHPSVLPKFVFPKDIQRLPAMTHPTTAEMDSTPKPFPQAETLPMEAKKNRHPAESDSDEADRQATLLKERRYKEIRPKKVRGEKVFAAPATHVTNAGTVRGHADRGPSLPSDTGETIANAGSMPLQNVPYQAVAMDSEKKHSSSNSFGPDSFRPVSSRAGTTRIDSIRRGSTSQSESKQNEPNEIQIHIGRIEVTATQPATAPATAAKPRRAGPSLDEYLRRRDARTK